MDVQLILATEIHLHTDAEANVWALQFEPRIIRCQTKYLEPLLGCRLYELLCQAYAAEQAQPSVAMPDRLDALHTALVRMLAQWVYYKSLPFIVSQTSNRGFESTGDVDGKAYGIFSSAIKTEAEDRTEDFKKWLAQHAGDYPELQQPLQPKTRRTPGGIVL
jgi:hypothetical protein